jgi:hypothetical protein
MFQTWLLAASVVAGGVVIFGLDRYINRHDGSPVSYLFIFPIMGGAYYFGSKGLLGAAALGVVINGVHAFVVRKQSDDNTVP